MGIDVQTFSKKLPKKRFGVAKGKTALELIGEKSREWANTNGLSPFFDQKITALDTLYINIYPLAESFEFTVSNDGVGVSCRTSNGGPGYHAAIIDLFDYLSKELGLVWVWGQAGEYCADETSYAVTRHFESLQKQMSDFLKAVITQVSKNDFPTGCICIPSGLGQHNDYLSGPLGHYPEGFLDDVMDSNPMELSELSKFHFPWWNKGIDSTFWENLLRGILWQNTQFREPLTRVEKQNAWLIKTITNNLDANHGVIPNDLAQAILELKSATESGQYSDKSKIGYLKQLVWHKPYQDWQISLPGSMIVHDNSENTNIQYYDDKCALYLSSLTAELDTADDVFTWPDNLSNAEHITENDLNWRISEGDVDENGTSVFAMIHHQSAKSHHLLLLTLTTENQACLSDLNTWIRTVRYG